MDAKLKHLEMIQGIINRMGSNSFMLKSWVVVIVSALFALSAKDANGTFIIVAFLPAIVLWGLDGYYLRRERLFRELYMDVAAKQEAEIDFSMNTAPYQPNVADWWQVCFSRTVLPFHGIIVVVIIIVTFILHKSALFPSA